jgi:hypothetical protein
MGPAWLQSAHKIHINYLKYISFSCWHIFCLLRYVQAALTACANHNEEIIMKHALYASVLVLLPAAASADELPDSYSLSGYPSASAQDSHQHKEPR